MDEWCLVNNINPVSQQLANEAMGPVMTEWFLLALDFFFRKSCPAHVRRNNDSDPDKQNIIWGPNYVYMWKGSYVKCYLIHFFFLNKYNITSQMLC